MAEINAVTLAVTDMAVSFAFYRSIGWELAYGGPDACWDSSPRPCWSSGASTGSLAWPPFAPRQTELARTVGTSRAPVR